MSAGAPPGPLLDAPPGVSLSGEQSRRATCLNLAVLLIGNRGGGISWQSLIAVAEWLYRGELP